MAKTAYEIRYTGMDGVDHTETHVCDLEAKNRLIIFLEERGAHGIRVDEISENDIQGYCYLHRSVGVIYDEPYHTLQEHFDEQNA